MNKYYCLKDIDSGSVDAIIVSKRTSLTDLALLVTEVKHAKPGEWTIRDIEEALPSDCRMLPVDSAHTLYY